MLKFEIEFETSSEVVIQHMIETIGLVETIKLIGKVWTDMNNKCKCETGCTNAQEDKEFVTTNNDFLRKLLEKQQKKSEQEIKHNEEILMFKDLIESEVLEGKPLDCTVCPHTHCYFGCKNIMQYQKYINNKG